jgi:hypothetical protein
MTSKLALLALAILLAAVGARGAAAYSDPGILDASVAATGITTCDGVSNVTLTITGHIAAGSATGLNYHVTPASGWTVATASTSSSSALISHTASSIDWTLALLGNTTVTVSYTLQHTGTRDGAAIPIQSTALLTMNEPTGPKSAGFSDATVPVSGCNLPPHANAGTDQTVSLSGSHTALVTLDGSATTDDDQLLVPLVYTWSENGATIATGVNPHNVPITGVGLHTITLTVYDGQFTDTDGLVISVVDPSPPVIVPHVSGTIGNNGWYVSDVVVTWTVTDLESDVVATSGCTPSTQTTDGASITTTCSATSDGGTSSVPVTFKRDVTSPSVVFTGNAGTYTVDQTVVVNCAATDVTSGVASSTCVNTNAAASGFTLGPHTITMTATDKAGNVGTSSYTFTVAVTYASLCNLTRLWVTNVSQANAMCVELTEAQTEQAKGNLVHKAQEIVEYQTLVTKAVPKYVTAARAAVLIAYSKGL